MTKHTAMVLLGIFVAALPVLGFPPAVRTTLLIVSGLVIAVLAYLTSVVYCSNCKKLIEDAENVFDTDATDTSTNRANPPSVQTDSPKKLFY